MLVDKIVGDADQHQQFGIVRRALEGKRQRLPGKLGAGGSQIGAGDAAQRLRIAGLSRQRRIECDDRFIGLTHFNQCIADRDKRCRRI